VGIINRDSFEFDFAGRDKALRNVAELEDSDYTELGAALIAEYLEAAVSDDPTDWMELHELCFLCHEKLTIPAVYWAGAPRSQKAPQDERLQIWLHPRCARGLAMRLLRDVRELITGDKEKADGEFLRWKKEYAGDL